MSIFWLNYRPNCLKKLFSFRYGIESVDRLIKWIESCTDIEKEDSILDLGCGNGVLLIELVCILCLFSAVCYLKYQT